MDYKTPHGDKLNPLDPSMFQRFLSRVERLLGSDGENERDALERGWF